MMLRRWLLCTLLGVSLVGFGFGSTATAAKKKGKKAAAAKAPKAAKAPAPQAPPAAAEMAPLKKFVGNWRCSGQFHGMPGMAAHAVASRAKGKLAHNGHWVVVNYTQRKTRKNAVPYNQDIYMTYDGGKKKYVVWTFGNMGDRSYQVGNGFEGDSFVTEGKSAWGARKSGTRITFTFSGKRKLAVTNEVQMKEGWKKIAEETCKR